MKGCIVTADGLNCQRTIAASIVEKGDDYMLALKGIQRSLHDNVTTFLDDPARPASPVHTSMDAGHGRIETRINTVCSDIAWLHDHHRWPSLAAIGKVVRSRERTYYLLSTVLSAKRFGDIARAHWGIENGLHWVLDVTMNKDHTRPRCDFGPQNVALLRRLALNLAGIKGSRGSMKGKPKKAG